MATSGSIDFNLTANQVIDFAFKKIEVFDAEETPSATDTADARRALTMMLKSWQKKIPGLYRQTFGSQALSNATASYTLSPVPYRVIEARYRNTDGRDIPMVQMTRQEYVDLPLKSSAGIPTQYYYDVQRAATTLYVWPVQATVTTETIQYTFQRIIEDVDDIANDIDIPQDWLETVGYGLAKRLLSSYGMVNSEVTDIANELLADAIDDEREDFVRLMPETRWEHA